MSALTFKVQHPTLEDNSIVDWQDVLNQRLREWGYEGPFLELDGRYGVQTRSFTSMVLYGMGIAQDAMKRGVTPELRIKVRNRRKTLAEHARYQRRRAWRRNLAPTRVHSPVLETSIVTDTWGYHPGVHDGMDIICKEGTVCFAICDAKVVRVSDDWWGLGNPGGSLGDRGDGIVILQAAESVGPIQKGDYFGYGHAEKPYVAKGQHVKAGQPVCRAGFANAGHVHFMMFRGDPGKTSSGQIRGVGNRDPRPAYDYARKNS